MSTSIMMALGTFRFSINTAAYQRLQRTSDYRWRAQERIGRLPAQQFLGNESTSINLEGEILPHFRGSTATVEAMRSLADSGQPQSLIDSSGRVWGQYCITHIEEGWQVLNQEGRPARVGFRMTLREYGEDSL